MYNAINKISKFCCSGKMIAAGAAMVLMFMATACGNKEADAAKQLYTDAEVQIDARNYAGAMVLLDTLNSRYPAQTQLRRDALRLRARAMEGIATDSIAAGSEALAAATLRREELQPKFRHVDSSVGLEGYFLPTGVNEKVMTATGYQARVSDKGFFYIVVNVQGKAIGLQRIEFVSGAETISSSEISPARIIKVEGSESASFNPEDLEGIGAWLAAHPGTNKIVFIGSKGKATAKIDAKQLSQTVLCYEFAEALQAQRLASLRREKYERMLATARDQLANLPLPSTDNK